jgi:hypothetical protein
MFIRSFGRTGSCQNIHFEKDCFVMIDFAKPKSGGFVFVDRVGALCVPSGVNLCTSERIGRQCVAYAIDSPALRFRGTSLVACHEYSYERAPP